MLLWRRADKVALERRCFHLLTEVSRPASAAVPRTLKGTRAQHCYVFSKPASNGEVRVGMRLASCFCDHCISHDFDSCSNTRYAGRVQNRILVAAGGSSGWESCDEGSDDGSDDRVQNAAARLGVQRTPSELISPARDTRKPHTLDCMCNVVVVLGDGQQCPVNGVYDYHLMRVVEGPHTLTTAVADAWGNTHPAGVEVVAGYFCELAQQDEAVSPQECGIYTYSHGRKALVSTAAVSMVGFTMNPFEDSPDWYILANFFHEAALASMSRVLCDAGDMVADDEHIDAASAMMEAATA